jgi:ATP-dependent Lhr-like helicase
VRGGRFVTGFGGEQYALPEAVESLRASRSRECAAIIAVAAADPVNLIGIVIPGERAPLVPGRQTLYRNGVLYVENDAMPATDIVHAPFAPATLATNVQPVSGLFQQ